MGKLENKISRILSLVLRHDPASAGIALAAEGWVKVDELLIGIQKKAKNLDRPLLEKIVNESEQKRFSFSADGECIRADDGHSFAIHITGTEQSPPELLYHGTCSRTVPDIEVDGLLKMTRQHVHLHADPRDAHLPAQKHPKPIILEIDSRLMANHGFKFSITKDGIWLTAEVPPDYLNRRFRL